MSNFNLGNQNISEWHKDIVKSVPALPTPSADLAGFRRFRTSDNLEFICDGTRWLTTEQLTQTLVPRVAQPLAAATQAADTVIPNYNASGIYLEAVQCFFFPVTVAQSNTNFYTIQVRVYNATTGADAPLTIGGTTDTKLFTTAGRGYSFAPTITPAVLAANSFTITAQMVPSGAPGTFFFWATAAYRRVG